VRLSLHTREALRSCLGVFDQVCDHIGVGRCPVPKIVAQNEGDSLARIPKLVQRLWRIRAFAASIR
jgi:hypothetical protein